MQWVECKAQLQSTTLDAMISFLEEKLWVAFPSEQAHLLAELTYEAYNDLVKARDFSELKSIVGELDQAQARTQERVDQLATAQERTERAIRQLARQLGGLSEAISGSLEGRALEVVPEILKYRWGMEIENSLRIECVSLGTIHAFEAS